MASFMAYVSLALEDNSSEEIERGRVNMTSECLPLFGGRLWPVKPAGPSIIIGFLMTLRSFKIIERLGQYFNLNERNLLFKEELFLGGLLRRGKC